ncbi:MAG TPA: PadR family transcriptional regulator [Anaerolineae bacterium]|nr:PadR family transcriptional regulator [Anaerolineae bacterium]HQH39375.1 PadR family transcriptional regulator [Anaerolineae bacterium]
MQSRGQRGEGWDHTRRMGQFLDPTLLLLLKTAPAHGYTLLGRLAEFGLDSLDVTVIYRALRDMADRGWITSTRDEAETQGPPRRVYTLTALGAEVLACCTAQLQTLQATIQHFLDLYHNDQ